MEDGLILEMSDKEFKDILTEAFNRKIFYRPQRLVLTVRPLEDRWRIVLEDIKDGKIE